MNRKQKIIVSITGIFIVLLALVGLTYAYFLTRIRGNENEKSISVTTANLELIYGDGNNLITASNIEPGWTTDGKDGRPNAKIFTVTNNGNDTVEGFNIYLENVKNTLSRKSDLIYTITCENTTEGATSKTCEKFEVVENEVNGTELVFPSVMSVVARDTLEPATEDTNAEKHTYTVIVTYKETGEDQSEDMNKRVEAKVNIYDSKTKFLASEIIKNAKSGMSTKYIEPNMLGVADNTTKPGENVSLANEKVLSYAFDDYGTSYYYRGSVEDNYVNFAGFIWRIVRINGDGSIRLILEGTLDSVKRTGLNIYAGETSKFNNLSGDNAYIGYMYGLSGASANVCVVSNNGVKSIDTNITNEDSCINGEWMNGYDATHQNLNDSTVKTVVDKFYETYIESSENNYHYEKYLADSLFCGDKSLATNGIGNIEKQLGYGGNNTYYSAFERLSHKLYVNNDNDYLSYYQKSEYGFKPTLMCAKGTTNNYSRYTSKIDTINETFFNVNVNDDLKYPIALLSADELVMAGAIDLINNTSYYLNDTFDNAEDPQNTPWLLMTSSEFDNRATSNCANVVGYSYNSSGSSNYGVRPVINLKGNINIRGEGTQTSPYIIG